MSGFSKYPVVLLGGCLAIVSYAETAQALVADEVRQIAEEVTVRIDGLNPGSGVLVAREGDTYWVLTAEHVVATEDEYYIIAPDGAEYPLDYSTVEKLPGVDLALLRFTSDRVSDSLREYRPYRTATLGNYAVNANDAYVFAYGWDADNRQPLMTAGQIIARDFALGVTRNPIDRGYKLFYTNVTEKGMSGGPILDTDGRLIGIHGQSDGQELYDETSGRLLRVKLGFSAGIPISGGLRALDRSGLSPALQIENSAPAPLSQQSWASITPYLGVSRPPENASAVDWSNWGNHLYRTGQFMEALRAFDRSIGLQSDFYPAWYQRGNVLYALGDEIAAIGSFDRTVDIKPDFYWAWRDRGALLSAMGDVEAAMESFDRAVEIQPDDQVVWYMRGNLLTQNFARYEEALASYDRALDVSPEFAPAWMGRGKALSEMGRYDEAMRALDRSIELDPESATARILQGTVFQEMEKPQQALASFDRALALSPEDAQLWAIKGQLLVDLGRRSEAIDALSQALRLQPNNPEIRSLLARLGGSR
ncbi:MAG TPA: serine protease [Oscillatoriales cyanobacterium M59_W2019_021]|nr:MAG: tetratricopeptide repeat protein [Cyanobacteria bacterium J055]HIK30128.1 serine protease [Oscillatoriales cyanobacterium M4454_W2019_049]HIK52262.1 serine protease [Oscillatoriales cyanobacterium M59_W2019_021]